MFMCPRTLYRQWESEEKVILLSENDLFFTLGSGTSSAWNENLEPLLNTITPTPTPTPKYP